MASSKKFLSLRIELQILVPLRHNNGGKFRRRHHRSFEEIVAKRFGGFTVEPRTVTGGWWNGQRLIKDKSRLYVIAVPISAIGASVAILQDLVRRHYAQDAAYVRVGTWASAIG